MSVTLADSYRGHAINFSSSAKHDDHSLIDYDASESELRDKLSGAVYGADNIPSLFNGQPPTTVSVLPHPTTQTRDDHVPHSIYSPPSSHHLPQPPPYGYDMAGSLSSPRSQFRPRSTRNDGHLPPHFPALASLLINTNSSVTASGMMLDPSLHQPPGSIYDPAMPHGALTKASLPEKHHHTLPQSRDPDNMDDDISRQTRPPNLVGHVGMPPPAARPKAPKTRFTAAEDALLVHLKEDKNLTWLQIQDFFPGRTHNTLQVRYCQRLKTKDVSWTDEKVSSSVSISFRASDITYSVGEGETLYTERKARFNASSAPYHSTSKTDGELYPAKLVKDLALRRVGNEQLCLGEALRVDCK